MKLNGNTNIITDNDIVTTGKHIGSNLNSVIESMEEDITKLKGNMKFIYANGSVGGGGGGGGSVTKWSIAATLGGKTISSGNTISLSSTEEIYPLVISISGGSSSYNVIYTYGGNSRTVTLNSDNNWRFSTNLRLTNNGTISIEATDNILVKNVYADYITKPYEFNDISLIRDNGAEYATTDIFIEAAQEEGLLMHSHYTISINAETSYHWVFNNEATEETPILNKNGDLDFRIPEEYLDPELANLYNGSLVITIVPENQDPEIIIKSVSFNLIPNTVYLKMSPQVGMIYDTEVLDPYQYNTNREIALDCRIYKGANQNRPGTLEIHTDEQDFTVNVQEGTTNTIKIVFRNPGWHEMTIVYTLGGSSNSVTKYIYCITVGSNFDWFKSIIPSSENYYRGWDSETSQGITPIADRYISMKTASQELEIPLNNYTEGCNLLINIGIQYNSINDVSNEIISIKNVSGNPFISIYQNKIEFKELYTATQNAQFFLNKTTDYNDGNFDNYHLITIALASVWRDSSTNTDYNECTVYLDGKLEGAVNSFTAATAIVGSLVLHSGNYAINHFDVSYFTPDNKYNRVFYDSDINYYYYSYITKSTGAIIDEDQTAILNFLYDSTTKKVNYGISNNLVKVDSTLYDNVAAHCNIPTLVLRVNRYIADHNDYDVLTWLNTGYVDTASSGTPSKWKIRIEQLRWGKNKTSTGIVNIPSSLGLNTRFYITLQGSSTMGYKAKNLALSIVPGSDLSENEIPIFSPNFKADDSSTFLHETSWNLKADVVDSSHTNNVAVGRFVNDNNNFDYSINQNPNPKIISHVKKCLDGFPTLVYFETINRDGTVDTYFLGVYSFNLGRDSYFNLGYTDLTQLDPNYLEDATNTNFSFTLLGKGGGRGINPLEGFVAAEVQDNSKFWDFSQYDSSVLFQQGDENGNFMFGDIKTAANYQSWASEIRNFVRSVSGAGGYLFKEMGKELTPVHDIWQDGTIIPNHTNDDEVAYHIPNAVPDYQMQYSRLNTTYTPYKNIDLPSKDQLTLNILQECIGSTDPESTIVPKLNFNSLAYYYVTCMTFGLVDSVQKNLTIKKWVDSFGLFFYDMDTCLGRDNAGNKSSYFCFSDYWRSKIKEYDENGNLIDRSIDKTTVAVRTVNDGCDINRDYFPIGSSIVGYDIPSSYLFAIAKYVKCLNEYQDAESYKSPQNIYAEWRQTGGVLETAETFINNYFASNLSGVPECLLNLNYRNKYLYSNTGTAFDSVSNNLHGTGIEEVKEWMEGRLHILDAYFNLSNEDVNITDHYKEPKISVNIVNPDVYILRDIFCGPNDARGINRAGTITFTVTGNEYAPVIFSNGSSVRRYLLEKSDVPYEITVTASGNQVTRFGGSQMWTSLDSINGFVSSLVGKDNFYFNTSLIDNIYGTEGTLNSLWSLTTPSAKNIVLNSPNYAGSLTIDNSFYNLQKIDISKSRISLTVNGSDVQEINCSNLNGASELNITNCNNLTNVNLSNASINKCNISPIWTSSIDLSGNKIKDLSVFGNDNFNPGTLTVINNVSLQKLTFRRFSTVNLSNDTALSTISCNDSDPTLLKSFTATNCKNLTSVELYIDGLQTLNLRGCSKITSLKLKGSNFDQLKFLDLRGTKIKQIEYDNNNVTDILDLSRFTNLGRSNSAATSYIDLGDNTELIAVRFANDQSRPVYLLRTFSGCTKLERVYGNIIINTASCFDGVTNFSIHGSDLSTAVWHGQSLLNDTKVKHPLDIIGAASPSASAYYWNNINATNITFGINNASSAFQNTSCTIFDYYYILSNLGSAINVSSIFAYNKNTDYGKFDLSTNNNPDKRLFKWGSSITSISFAFGYENTGHTIYLESPTIVDGEIITNDGLFSNLTSCTNFSGPFYGYSYNCDRYLFRRVSGGFVATSLSYFSPSNVLNTPPQTIDTETINNILNDKPANTGNLLGFFNNLPALTDISGFLSGVNYIDFSKIFKIPSGVQTLTSSFTPRNGTGTFVLSEYFVNPTNVKNLWQSFRITSSGTVNMEITDNTFSEFTNLVEVGYGGSGSFSSTDFRNSCFTGFNKTFNGSFPFNIFHNNPKLKKAAAIFMNATTNTNYTDLKLPGNMFVNTPLLTDVSGMFYNIGTDYTLSETGNFTNCSNLSVVDYLFAQDIVNANKPHLSGQIPYKLFWHGETIKTVICHGTNERHWVVDEDEEGHWEYDNIDMSVPEYTHTVNNTISSMKYCFMHSDLDAYIKTNYAASDIEYNPNYHPYRFVSRPTTDGYGPFIDIGESNIDTREKTFIWAFDGAHYPTEYTAATKNNFEVLDKTFVKENTGDLTSCIQETVVYSSEEVKGEGHSVLTNTYVAPPDLLRYCTSKCDIRGLFSGSGVSGFILEYNGTNNKYNMYGYGITGRICPYMLKPVKDTTNVAEMFKFCKKLSYYRILEDTATGKAYMIPPEFFTYATNITDLHGMFQDTLQPQYSDLSDVFKPLTGTLDITDLFYSVYWDSSNPAASGGYNTDISEVFKTNEMSAVSRAFCNTTSTTTTDRVINQKITFNNVFNSKYASVLYEGNGNFYNVFRGYSRIGDAPGNDRFGVKTLVTSNINKNYLTWDERSQ